MVGVVAALVQTYWKSKRKPQAMQAGFNLAILLISASAATVACYLMASLGLESAGLLLALVAATAVYYGCNTVLLSMLLGLIEHKSLFSNWQTCRFWSLPYFLVGTAISGLMVNVSRSAGYPAALLMLTGMVLVFVAYRAHLLQAQTLPIQGQV